MQRPWLRNSLIAVGILAFLAIDVLLVALALGRSGDVPAAETSADPAAWLEESAAEEDLEADSEEDDSSPPDESVESTPEAEELDSLEQSTSRLLSVVNSTVAWRAEGGVCDETGQVELTIDGGQTWGSTYPGALELGAPLWISAADYQAVQAAIATGDDCAETGYATTDSGAIWTQEGDALEDAVFIEPGDRSRISVAGQSLEGPCEHLVDVAVGGDVISVVCEDGKLWTAQSDAAQSDAAEWSESMSEGAVAVAASEQTQLAAVESSQCGGMVLMSFGEDSIENRACIPEPVDNPVGVDLAGESVWVWVGDALLISSDDGWSVDG